MFFIAFEVHCCTVLWFDAEFEFDILKGLLSELQVGLGYLSTPQIHNIWGNTVRYVCMYAHAKILLHYFLVVISSKIVHLV